MAFHHRIWWIISGTGVISSQVRANTDAAGSILSANTDEGPAKLVGLFALKWGWLIGVVLIALVVIARNRNAP